METKNSSLSPQLQRALHAIEAATAEMTEEQLTWHPEGKWSSALILEHLSLAFSSTVRGMRRALEAGKPDVRKSTLKERVAGLVVIKLGHVPSGRKAPAIIVPQGLPPQEAKAAIRESLARVDEVINVCEQRFGNQADILVHPALGPLSAGEWRKFHCVHTLHHMRQIKRLRLLTKKVLAANQRQ